MGSGWQEKEFWSEMVGLIESCLIEFLIIVRQAHSRHYFRTILQ